MVPEVLVLFFDALMCDDSEIMAKLLKRFPLMKKSFAELTKSERDILVPDYFTNYFYVSKDNVGLVAQETLSSLSIASESGIKDLIYWTHNTDPVQIATVADVANVMAVSTRYNTPVNVLKVIASA
jgi:hypothetical protein